MRKLPRNKIATGVVVSVLIFCLTARSTLNAADPDASLSNRPRSLVEDLFQHARDLAHALHERPYDSRSRSEYLRILDAYNQVIRLDSDPYLSATSLARRAELQREMADATGDGALYAQAIESFRRIVAERPHSAFVGDALINIAQIYEENLQDLDGAAAAYRELIQYFPTSVLAREARAVLLRFEEQLKNRPVDVMVSGDTSSASQSFYEAFPGARLTNVRNFSGPDYARVVIDLSDATEHTGRLSGENQLSIRLDNAIISPSLYGRRFIVGDSNLLKRIMVKGEAPAPSGMGTVQSQGAQIEIEVGSLSDYSIFKLSGPERIVIDLHAAGRDQKPRYLHNEDSDSNSTEEGNLYRERNPYRERNLYADARPTPAGEPSPARPARGERSGSWRTQQPLLSLPEITDPILPPSGAAQLANALGGKDADSPIKCIVIDPGHGGHDTGTISSGGMREKELVLDVALRLRNYIKRAYPDIEVIMTRETDRFIALEQRTAIANSRRADLFISIHANASPSRIASGVETYFASPDRVKSEDQASESKEQPVPASDMAAKTEAKSVEPIMASVSAGGRVAQSRELARYIQAGLVRGIGATSPRAASNRGVKHAPFAVLLGADMPSVLAEVSFLSNPNEEALLRTASFRGRIATSIFAGLSSYLKKMRAAQSKAEAKSKKPDSDQKPGAGELGKG
ncbi:MAG: N-acetylmuramoyl-L-alanine amidase [Blastocatellia bacterium]|nr:N-acetylmuramoyl-L-alanine amidase [Blastocatellia bacterium]